MAYVGRAGSGDVRADQCLFGYQDGHRLLATSMPLGEEAPMLTQLSDLAPDTVFGASEGYWTGLPVPGIGQYALMRTWPAPEMPRPGCVWTHVILLDPVVLEKVVDLSTLRPLARRPHSIDDLAAYGRSLALWDPPAALPRTLALPPSDALRRLIASLYGSTDPAVAAGAPGMLDDAVFAVWSQQWPRLRRNLRFQTAASRTFQPTPGARLDLIQVLADALPTTQGGPDKDREWLAAAVADIERGGGPFRDTLWRYGQDVRRQRGSFRPLCEVEIVRASSCDNAGVRLLRTIADAFPERDDAATLKQDAVDGVLAPSAQLDILWFLLADGGEKMMPPPSAEGVARLARLWPDHPDELLRLAERTAGCDEEVRRSVFETVTGAMPIQRFWELTRSFPRVRERMVAARPELMAVEGVMAIDSATLASLVQFLPEDGAIAKDVIPRLLTRDDADLAEATTAHFPKAVALQVVAAADREPMGVGRAWERNVVGRPAVLLDPAVLGRVTRTSLLYDIAEALGWLTADVIRAGTEPWIAAMVDGSSDLSDEKRDTLRAFLVALALAAGDGGGPRVLEELFEAVHEQILNSRLPWKARDILTPVLPDVGWLRSWDLSLRLRLAVAYRYVASGYDPESYARLSASRKTRTMLAEAAEEVDGGKKLARAAVR